MRKPRYRLKISRNGTVHYYRMDPEGWLIRNAIEFAFFPDKGCARFVGYNDLEWVNPADPFGKAGKVNFDGSIDFT